MKLEQLEKLKWNLFSDLGTTSKTYKAQDRFQFYIKKMYRKNIDKNYFQRECQAIEMLKGKNHFTKNCFIDEKNKTIYMDYLGKKLSKTNCPRNWKEQIEEILDKLQELNLYISDLQRNNICVLGNTINLIDFGVVNFNSFDRISLKNRLIYVFETLID